MTDDDTIPVEAVDTEDMVRSQRLRDITDARRNCRKTREKAENVISQEREGQYTATSHYRHAVESYAREAEALFSQTDEGRRYWTQYEFGTMTISPAVEYRTTRKGPKQILTQTDSEVAGKLPEENIQITSLNTLFQMDSPITFAMDCPVVAPGRSRGSTIQTLRVKQQINFGILDQMYSVVNGYLSELGLDIEIDNSETTASADYSDIV